MDIKHIRDIREDNDMTQAQIAKILNISQRAYSYYETGQHNIPLNILCQLADYYKCSTDYLLGRTNIKSTK
ncbi:MAG: helix-turn-helix transcriptional regulator [Dorea sp.]|jgi:transcriptional regulator with XRE-family HTH domain|nr:helix-turn-helix transcriptional regulator [Dorea sp.]